MYVLIPFSVTIVKTIKVSAFSVNKSIQVTATFWLLISLINKFEVLKSSRDLWLFGRLNGSLVLATDFSIWLSSIANRERTVEPSRERRLDQSTLSSKRTTTKLTTNATDERLRRPCTPIDRRHKQHVLRTTRTTTDAFFERRNLRTTRTTTDAFFERRTNNANNNERREIRHRQSYLESSRRRIYQILL
jgi:hypothetical protein